MIPTSTRKERVFTDPPLESGAPLNPLHFVGIWLALVCFGVCIKSVMNGYALPPFESIMSTWISALFTTGLAAYAVYLYRSGSE